MKELIAQALRKMDPKQFYVEKVIKNVEILDGRTAVQFTSKINDKQLLYFSIDENNNFHFQALLYQNENGKSVIFNGQFSEKESEVIKDTWEKFFQAHKNEEKLKNIRLKYVTNYQ